MFICSRSFDMKIKQNIKAVPADLQSFGHSARQSNTGCQGPIFIK